MQKLQYFIFLTSFFYRYLYTGLMPSPKLDGGMVPIFYFLNASHTENAFRECLHKFYYDVKRVKTSMPRYEHCSLAPKQCITDMSLVIFRPALGQYNFSVLIVKWSQRANVEGQRDEFQDNHPFFHYPFRPSFLHWPQISSFSPDFLCPRLIESCIIEWMYLHLSNLNLRLDLTKTSFFKVLTYFIWSGKKFYLALKKKSAQLHHFYRFYGYL